MGVVEDIIDKFFPPVFSTDYIIDRKIKFSYIFGIKELEL
jgi:hypothetical protein